MTLFRILPPTFDNEVHWHKGRCSTSFPRLCIISLEENVKSIFAKRVSERMTKYK